MQMKMVQERRKLQLSRDWMSMASGEQKANNFPLISLHSGAQAQVKQ